MAELCSRILAVVSEGGEHLCWVNEAEARDLIRERRVSCVRDRRSRVRQLVAIEPEPGARLRIVPARLGGLKTSYRQKVATHPYGVWTLKPAAALELPDA